MFLNDRSSLLVGIWAAIAATHFADCLTIASTVKSGFRSTNGRINVSKRLGQPNDRIENVLDDYGDNDCAALSRREAITKTAALASVSFLPAAFGSPETSSAAVGTLPEFADTNAIVNGLTINVADASQQKAMIDFLIGAFSFDVQRQRIQGSVEETVSISRKIIDTVHI